jgi:hypothetical protein
MPTVVGTMAMLLKRTPRRFPGLAFVFKLRVFLDHSSQFGLALLDG